MAVVSTFNRQPSVASVNPLRSSWSLGRIAIGAAMLATTGISLASPAANAAIRSPRAVPAIYYLALGDSGPAGAGATDPKIKNPTNSNPKYGYVNLTYLHELKKHKNLKLKNLACFGETTTSMLTPEPSTMGGLPCAAAPKSQMAAALAFLTLQKGHIAFISLGIGGNDVSGSATFTEEQLRLTAIESRITGLLSSLKAAAPGVAIFGSDYHAVLVGPMGLIGNGQAPSQYCGGAPSCTGREAAQINVTGTEMADTALQTTFVSNGEFFVNGAAGFDMDNWALTGKFQGKTVPQNVANDCNFSWICADAAGGFSLHMNDRGQSIYATAQEAVIDTKLTSTFKVR